MTEPRGRAYWRVVQQPDTPRSHGIGQPADAPPFTNGNERRAFAHMPKLYPLDAPVSPGGQSILASIPFGTMIVIAVILAMIMFGLFHLLRLHRNFSQAETKIALGKLGIHFKSKK
jgi:hypothetical protein